jgi:catechol 2,3-dioxygenase-like lactoylglutathione lyase family enzyme
MMKLSRLGFVMLGVRDLEQSVPFYRDTLGLPLQFASGEIAFFDGGGVTVCLRRAPELKDPTEDGRTELVFTVDDVDAACEALTSRGVQFRIAPRIVTRDQFAADFRDPDGHTLSIFGPRAATKAT